MKCNRCKLYHTLNIYFCAEAKILSCLLCILMKCIDTQNETWITVKPAIPFTLLPEIHRLKYKQFALTLMTLVSPHCESSVKTSS